MPVETGASDRHHRRTIVLLVLRVRCLFQQRHMAGHAVIVIEEAVADEDFGLREIGTKAGDNRFGLRQRRGRPGRHPAARRQHNKKSRILLDISTLPALVLFCDSLSRRAALSRYLGRPGPAPRGMSLCTGETRGYLVAWAMPMTVRPDRRSY